MNDHDFFDSDVFALPGDLEGLAGARAAAEDKFLDRANVVGVGLGHKITAGEVSQTPSVMVLVTEKRPEQMLGSRDKISRTIDSTPTDVLEVGHLFAGGDAGALASAPVEPLQAIDAQKLANRVRPVRPGYSVGHPDVTPRARSGPAATTSARCPASRRATTC